MKKLVATVLMISAFTLSQAPAFAQSAAQTAQQEKMKACNADAATKKLTGDARKDFMKTCLSAGAASTDSGKAVTAQQQKMKDCNAQAKGKTGDARKTFMSTCLKSAG